MNFAKVFYIIIFYLITIFSSTVKADQSFLYIDMNYLLSNSTAGKSITNKLTALNKKNIDNFKKIEEKIKLEENKILTQKNVINKDEYESMVVKIQNEIKDYKKLRYQKNNELTKKKNKATAELISYINKILITYSDEKKISFILKKSNIIIGKKEFDITNDILKITNKKIKNIELK